MTEDGVVTQHDGLRPNLARDLQPGDSSTHEVIIGPPPNADSTLLCLTLVQEQVCWFDEREPRNRLLLRLHGMEAVCV